METLHYKGYEINYLWIIGILYDSIIIYLVLIYNAKYCA